MDSGWQMGEGAWKDNHALGMDVEKFILENPQWVLYLRRDERFTCPEHRNQATGSPYHLEAPCTRCFGTGIKIDPLIVPCRITMGAPNVTHRETEFRTNPGWLEYYTAAADFPRGVMPQTEDLVLICEWDKPSQTLGEYPRAKVIRIQTVYVIKQVNDYFERELSHFGCGLEIQQQDVDRYRSHIGVLRNVPILNLNNPAPGQSRWSQKSYW